MLLPQPKSEPCPYPTPWSFLTNAVWTKDEASGQVRQFPSKEYLGFLTEERPKHKVFAVDKSRRMMVTWWGCAVYLYDTLTEHNHANWIASDKLEKSAYLLGAERILFIYNHIPEKDWPNKPELIPEAKEGLGYRRLVCPATGSYLMATARGETQMQQYTATNIWLDEFSRWERAEQSWAAIQPTLQGGGHADLIGTPELGAFMYRLLYGTG